MKCILTLVLFSFATNSWGALFSITNRTGACTTLCDLLETEVNKVLPDADQSNYLNGMANSGVISQKGLGVDYASNMEVFVFGAGIGVGADLGENTTGDLISGDVQASQVRGFSAASSVMLGLNAGVFSGNFGRIKTKDLNIYINFLSVSTPSVDGLSGDSTAAGLHFQYKIISTKKAPLGTLAWGGLEFITGIEWSQMKVSFTESMNKSVTYEGASANFTGEAKVGADISVFTIPLELSTNINLLYLVSAYAGTGVDLSFGSAESIALLTGSIEVDGGSGTGTLDLGSSESPDAFALRGFAGIQLNLLGLKFYTQVNRGFTNGTLGIAVGTRIVW